MSEKFEKLCSWGIENGAVINGELDLKDVDGNRSLFTKKDITKGDVIIKSSKNLSISVKNNLILNLLQEIILGESSKYSIYLSLLPERVDLPKFSSTEIEYFKTNLPELYNLTSRKQQQVDSLYSLISKLDIDEKYRTQEFVLYLYELYQSRAWKEWGFIPLLDLIQHENNPNLSIKESEDKEYILVTALRDIKAGEELFHRYNCFNPLILYFNYGIDFFFNINFMKIKYDDKNCLVVYGKPDVVRSKADLHKFLEYFRSLELDFDPPKDVSNPISISSEFRLVRKLKKVFKDKLILGDYENKCLQKIKDHNNNQINIYLSLLQDFWSSLI